MKINTRTLGKSGIDVTEIGLGLWAAGGSEGEHSWGPTDDQEVLDSIDMALDEGVTFFDTADVYGDGHSEKLLGRAMAGRRDKFIVATKIGWVNFDWDAPSTQYATVDKLIAGVESNLKRLNTDYLDLLQSHINFHEKTLDVFLEGFEKLKQQGKVRAYGVSTSDFAYLKAFNHAGGCSSLQIDYSILNRTPEADIFPYCQANNIGVVVRGPLAMGILTGKYDVDAQFDEGDWRNRWLDDPEENKIYREDLAKVTQLKPLANGRSLAQLALQFVLDHPAVTTVIPGAKNRRQLTANVAAAQLPPLSDMEMKTINAITPPGGGRKIWPA